MGFIYGGEIGHALINTDGTKACFTPDGTKFFSSNEQLLDYIAEKCGKDVAGCIDLESDVQVMLTELSEKVDFERPGELMKDIDLDKTEFTEQDRSRLKEALALYQTICSGVIDIIYPF